MKTKVNDYNDLDNIRAAVKEAMEELLTGPGGPFEELSQDNFKSKTLSVEAAANVLGISKSSMWSAVWSGEIPTFKIGRRVLVSKTTIANLLSSEPQKMEAVQ